MISSISYHFAGIDWHCNLQIDHNIITPGDMPHFIMETYRECRGPPQFFKLDKYGIILVICLSNVKVHYL